MTLILVWQRTEQYCLQQQPDPNGLFPKANEKFLKSGQITHRRFPPSRSIRAGLRGNKAVGTYATYRCIEWKGSFRVQPCISSWLASRSRRGPDPTPLSYSTILSSEASLTCEMRHSSRSNTVRKSAITTLSARSVSSARYGHGLVDLEIATRVAAILFSRK